MRILRLEEIENPELKEIYEGIVKRFGDGILRSEGFYD